ncbi:unnamed protein product [Closterium sp. NIES-64]|nr:unnamed protein product [Closterium sp. NIES-64]
MLEALFEKSFKERSASNMTGQGMASGASFESDARMNAAALPANMLVAAQGGDQACTFKLENEACSFSDPFLLQVEPGPVQKSDLPYAQLTPAEIINGAPFSGVPKGVPCASAQQETFRYLSAALGACEPLDPALYTCQNLDDPNLDMPLQELEAVESLLGQERRADWPTMESVSEINDWGEETKGDGKAFRDEHEGDEVGDGKGERKGAGRAFECEREGDQAGDGRRKWAGDEKAFRGEREGDGVGDGGWERNLRRLHLRLREGRGESKSDGKGGERDRATGREGREIERRDGRGER